MDALPSLFLKDTLQLTARLMEPGGTLVSNAVLRFSSDDPAVVSVTESGRLLAVGVGSANVTATAVGYAASAQATRIAQVRGLLEVDSIRPQTARFGEVLQIFGVGLFPDSLFSVTVGGHNAEIRDYVPQDPQNPNRLGRLFVWTPPPAPRRSALTVLGFNGGLVFPESLEVVQRDVYEPNEVAPAELGEIPLGVRNPGLAFEARIRTEADVGVDWYTFTNGEAHDRTVVVFSEMVGAESFLVVLTDSLFFDASVSDFGFGSRAWTIGRESYRCDGLSVTSSGEAVPFAEVRFPFFVSALGDLPAGQYHIFVPFAAQGDPSSYELLVLPGYVSLGNVGRDPLEENDYCDVAAPLPPGTSTLTIDNPHDIDWFRFTETTGQVYNFTARTDGTANADLDLYLIRDFRPDSLVLLRSATAAGDADEVIANQFLSPGDYFLVAFDFAGIPTGYTLTVSAAVVPAAASSSAAMAAPPSIEGLRAKRRLAQAMRPSLTPLLEALRAWRR